MTIPGVNLVTYPLIKQAPSVNCSPLGATIKVASYRKRTLCTLVLIYVTVNVIINICMITLLQRRGKYGTR